MKTVKPNLPVNGSQRPAKKAIWTNLFNAGLSNRATWKNVVFSKASLVILVSFSSASTALAVDLLLAETLASEQSQATLEEVGAANQIIQQDGLLHTARLIFIKKLNLENIADEPLEDDDSMDEDDEDDEDDIEFIAGDYSVIINPEITLDSNKTTDDKTFSALSLSTYGFFQLQLTDAFNVTAEASLSTQGDEGQYLAFEKPELTFSSLALAYSDGDLGIAVGKFDLQRDAGYFNQIWGRQLYGLNTFAVEDLDLSDVIGLRGWIDLGDDENDHYLYVGSFFRDNTALSDSYLSRSGNDRDELTGLGYTKKLNNWTVSLHGDEIPYIADWEYVVGVSKLAPDEAEDDNREISTFTGFYGDYELSNDLSISPIVEVLYRDGADGIDQNVLSASAGVTFSDDNWAYGGYYGFRRTSDKEEREITRDKEAQVFVTYTFDSGMYIDFAHQFALLDEDKNNTTILAVGIPLTFNFNGNIYGKQPNENDKPQMNQIRRIIRR